MLKWGSGGHLGRSGWRVSGAMDHTSLYTQPHVAQHFWATQAGLPLHINATGLTSYGALSQTYTHPGVTTYYGALVQKYVIGYDPAIATAVLTGPAPILSADATMNVLDGASLVGPRGVVTAYGGANASLTGPSPALTATGTNIPVARAELTGPRGVITSTALMGGVSGAVLVGPRPGAVTAYSGAVAELTLTANQLSVSSSGTMGAVASATLALTGNPVVSATATVEAVARAVLVGPSPAMAPHGSAWLVGPRGVVHAVAHQVVAVTYEAYAINLTTGAVSHYTNYPFDNLLRFGNKYYGVKSDGLFEIGGSLDLTLPIEAHIKTFQTNLGDKNQKRLPYVYASGRSDGGVIIGVTADEGETYEYESDWGEVAGSTNHRTTVGKGIKGVYYSLDVKNVNGGSLELDEISAHVAPTTRAV